MPAGSVWLSDRVKEDLERIAKEHKVSQEAIANVILRLTFSDDQEVRKVINLIKSANLGGQMDLTKKGW